MDTLFVSCLRWRPRAGSPFGNAGKPDYRRLFYAGVLAVMLSGGGARADSGLPADTLKAVKSATVLLHVTLPDSATAEGSGFFAVEPNVVLTNAHVLGMLRPEGRPPQRIDVTVHSGQEDERTLAGQLLGVDRSTDLAVLRVTGKDLPEPLQVVSARDLTETQTVYVFGFPFGKELGKEITVSSSSVSSLRHDANHILQKVQVNGGMHPGNSGGPVVDAQGRVVGVAVSGIRQTQINFAVPGDYVHVILNGRVTGLEVVHPYRDGDAVKAPVTVRLLDPLDRVQKVSLQVWTGDHGQSRHAATTEPKPLPGDSPVTTVALDHARGAAKGEVTLPPLSAGKVYWLRPVYVNAAGETHWVAGVVHQAKPPVDREPVLLKYTQPADERTRVNLTSTATFQVRDFEGEMRRLAVDLGAELEEQGEHRTDTEGLLTLAVSYRKFNWQVKLDDQAILPGDRVQRVSRQITSQTAQLRVDPEGSIHLQPRRGTFRSEVGELNEQVIQSLQAIAVPLPGKTVTPGNPWKASRTLLVSTLGSPEPGLADLTYTYLGIRKVADRSEALISLAGTLRSPKGQGRAMGGRMTGDADVDVTTGRVNSAQVLIDVDMDVGEGQRTAKLSGTLEVRLRRTLLKAAEASAAPAPSAPTAPVRSPAAEAGSPKGETREIDNLKVTALDLDARPLVACLRWTDEKGSSFDVLTRDGVLRKVSFPDFKVFAEKDFERKCEWLDISAEGLLLTMADKQEVWVVDPEKLEVKGTIEVPNLRRAASAPGLSIGVASAGSEMYVLDLKTMEARKYAMPGNVNTPPAGYDNPTMTPDGKYLFTTGGIEQMGRFRLEDGRFWYEETSPRLGPCGSAGILVSPDSRMVCMPSGGGNGEIGRAHV